MNLDITKNTIEELITLRDTINDYISNYKDDYLYICKVRSYGRNWTEHINNAFELQNLCDEYNGNNGIVDIYSTNPNLSVRNYGDTMYIVSENDLKQWQDYTYLKNHIPNVEEEIDKWDNRDNVPFSYRPHFAPSYSREDLELMKETLKNYDMSFVPPVSYNVNDEDI
jgi:hypothetical protein